MTPDPITLELYRHRFSGIAEEMGITLQRTSYSPNIKERLDFSCALFDASGRLVAQAAHIPAHLGAMPDSVAAALAVFDDWQPGDVVLLNDPYAGGSHLPDITMISPVFLAEMQPGANAPQPATGKAGPQFFAASRAHHADVGGMSPGSLPLSTELVPGGHHHPAAETLPGRRTGGSAVAADPSQRAHAGRAPRGSGSATGGPMRSAIAACTNWRPATAAMSY